LSEFIKRTFTGTAFVIIMLGTIIISQITLILLLLLVGSFALYEYFSIFKNRGFKPFTYLGIITGASVLILIFLERENMIAQKYLALVLLPVMGMFFSFFFVNRTDTVVSILVTISGFVYIILPLSLIPFITQNGLTENYDPQLLLGTLFIIWTYDTGAYISGILFGKHKMIPRLSPKKSWEGLAGGSIFAVFVSFVISRYFLLLNTADWMILGLIIIAAATAGDLFESLIKREAGIKDSGNILPGHGGMLDRFDSVFFAIPFVFLYIHLFKL